MKLVQTWRSINRWGIATEIPQNAAVSWRNAGYGTNSEVWKRIQSSKQLSRIANILHTAHNVKRPSCTVNKCCIHMRRRTRHGLARKSYSEEWLARQWLLRHSQFPGCFAAAGWGHVPLSGKVYWARYVGSPPGKPTEGKKIELKGVVSGIVNSMWNV